MKRLIIAGMLLLFGAILAPACMSAAPQASDTQSAQAFVQSFYDWYLKAVKGEANESAEEVALKTKTAIFSKPLVAGLKEDLAAAAKTPDEVVGLDFDPFLNAQDVCDPYKTGKVSQDGDSYKVEVMDSCPDKPAQPAVIAVVQKTAGLWMFVNFLYPGNGDLLQVLKDLKKERENPSKQ